MFTIKRILNGQTATRWCIMTIELTADSAQHPELGVLSITGEAGDVRPDGTRNQADLWGHIKDDMSDVHPAAYRMLGAWHLNDIHAGCEHQDALGWSACRGYHAKGETCPVTTAWDERQIGNVTAREAKWGTINPKRCRYDAVGVKCPTCGYYYGSACTRRNLPNEVIEYIKNLRDTK